MVENEINALANLITRFEPSGIYLGLNGQGISKGPNKFHSLKQELDTIRTACFSSNQYFQQSLSLNQFKRDTSFAKKDMGNILNTSFNVYCCCGKFGLSFFLHLL